MFLCHISVFQILVSKRVSQHGGDIHILFIQAHTQSLHLPVCDSSSHLLLCQKCESEVCINISQTDKLEVVTRTVGVELFQLWCSACCCCSVNLIMGRRFLTQLVVIGGMLWCTGLCVNQNVFVNSVFLLYSITCHSQWSSRLNKTKNYKRLLLKTLNYTQKSPDGKIKKEQRARINTTKQNASVSNQQIVETTPTFQCLSAASQHLSQEC